MDVAKKVILSSYITLTVVCCHSVSCVPSGLDFEGWLHHCIFSAWVAGLWALSSFKHTYVW